MNYVMPLFSCGHHIYFQADVTYNVCIEKAIYIAVFQIRFIFNDSVGNALRAFGRLFTIGRPKQYGPSNNLIQWTRLIKRNFLIWHSLKIMFLIWHRWKFSSLYGLFLNFLSLYDTLVHFVHQRGMKRPFYPWCIMWQKFCMGQ